MGGFGVTDYNKDKNIDMTDFVMHMKYMMKGFPQQQEPQQTNNLPIYPVFAISQKLNEPSWASLMQSGISGTAPQARFTANPSRGWK